MRTDPMPNLDTDPAVVLDVRNAAPDEGFINTLGTVVYGGTHPPGPPATAEQVRRLDDWGYPYDAGRLTFMEARVVIALAEHWGVRYPAGDDDMRSYNDAYDDGEADWPPSLEDRRDAAICEAFPWPIPQYRVEDDAASRLEKWERNDAHFRAKAAFSSMTLAERVALRRVQGLDRLTTYVKTRLRRADPGLRAAIRALLTEAEWQAALTDPHRHQVAPAGRPAENPPG